MRSILPCVFALGLVSSCEREVAQEPKGPLFTEITWDVPFRNDMAFGTPLWAALVDPDTLLYLYNVDKAAGERHSKVCLVTLSTHVCRWLEYPYSASVGRISSNEISVKPGFGREAGETPWTFVDVASLKERIDPNIPPGRYFPEPGIDAVIGGEDEDEIWLRDRTTGQEYTLPASMHGLERNLWVAMASGRILLTGWPDDVDTFWLPRTQLWSFPELKKLAEYQTSQPWSWQVFPETFGDLFVYPLTPGVLQVASLRDGQNRFVLGQPPATAEVANEHNGGIAPVQDTTGYVRETGIILTVEQIAKEHVALNAYDIVSGKKIHTVEMHNKRIEGLLEPIHGLKVEVSKIEKDWVLFELVADPRDDPDKGRCTMRLFPYRIRDFQKAHEPIEFMWGCFLDPIIDNGRLMVPGKDNVKIYNLADLVRFDQAH